MKTRLWKYWRIAKSACGRVPAERITSAKRQAPSGFTLISSRGAQYTFRKRLPLHVREARLHQPDSNDERAPY
jgi:hypothetical protein